MVSADWSAQRLKYSGEGSDRVGLVSFALEQNAQRFQHIILVVGDQDPAHQLTLNRVSHALSINQLRGGEI
jgi:hypothetical protein